MQNVFMFAKIGALVIIIIAGLVWLCLGMSLKKSLTMHRSLIKVYYVN